MDQSIKEKNKAEDDKKSKKLSSEELDKKLEECQKEKAEYLAGWQRARADFLNYRKEERERIGEILKYGNEELILKILPILDNFNLVEEKLPRSLRENENIKGFLQVRSQILNLLKNLGIEEIESEGKKFDPNFHEVMETAEIEGEESGKIIEEIKKGYLLNGRVVRPAKVKVVK